MNLRPFKDDDIAFMERWLYESHVAEWYKHPDHWLNELRERHGEFSFLTHFIAEHEGVPFGFCQYYDTFFAQEHEVWNDEPNVGEKQGEIFSIDYLIGEPEFLRRGFGKEMIVQMLEMLRKTGAKTVIVEPEKENAASNRALETSGFAWNGTDYHFEFESSEDKKMLLELIITFVFAAIVAGLIILRKLHTSKARVRQSERRLETIPGTQLAPENAAEITKAISAIESLILTSNDGQELALTRPNAVQLEAKRYREICVRGSSAMGQTVQGAMPILAQAQTLNQIAKVAPNGLFAATAPIQDLMKYADGTVGSVVMKNGISGHAGFAEVALKATNPAAVIGGAMAAMAMISGQHYMSEISEQLKSVDQKLEKLIGYHHDEKVGVLKNANRELYELASKTNTDASDIVACQRLGEKCGEVYYEYQTRLEGVSVDTKERWINKAKELRELGDSLDDSELNFTIQMCYQASVLYEKCKLAEIAVRMKIGSGQERFITEKVETLQKNNEGAFHRNIQQLIDEYYAPVLEKTERIVEAVRIPIFFGNTAEEAENIQRKKETILETVADDSTDLTQGLLRLLSEPKETIIMLGETADSPRVFVLDE